jgi:hypothetical protein
VLSFDFTQMPGPTTAVEDVVRHSCGPLSLLLLLLLLLVGTLASNLSEALAVEPSIEPVRRLYAYHVPSSSPCRGAAAPAPASAAASPPSPCNDDDDDDGDRSAASTRSPLDRIEQCDGGSRRFRTLVRAATMPRDAFRPHHVP